MESAQDVAKSRLTVCRLHPKANMPMPLRMKAIPTSSASVAKPMFGSETITIPASSSTAPAKMFQPRSSIDVEGGDDAKHADRDQPDSDQQRNRRDPSDGMADQQDADDRGEHAEQRERPTALGSAHKGGCQLENAIEEQEDPRDHRQRRQAVARLDQDGDPRRDAEHTDKGKQPPPSGCRAHIRPRHLDQPSLLLTRPPRAGTGPAVLPCQLNRSSARSKLIWTLAAIVQVALFSGSAYCCPAGGRKVAGSNPVAPIRRDVVPSVPVVPAAIQIGCLECCLHGKQHVLAQSRSVRAGPGR